MPKVNTFNYDTIASWNGSEDLFVVEQPDGTKVATPAMVKQFIEAGDFEATGEVKDGHGNILADMAKSADVDAEIGNLSQTGLTGDSVAEQLDTAREQIAAISSLYLVTTDSASANTSKVIDIGTKNGVFLLVLGNGGMHDLLGMYLIKVTHNQSGTVVKTIVAPAQYAPTITATAISTTGSITIQAPSGAGCDFSLYKFNLTI